MLATMCQWNSGLLLLAALLTEITVHATQLSDKEYQVFTNRERAVRRDVKRQSYDSDSDSDSDDSYGNVFGAIWVSDQGNLVQGIAGIDCSELQSIANDPSQVRAFVTSIASGDAPPFIASKLPETAATEFALAFSDVLSIATDDYDVSYSDYSADIYSAFDDIASGETSSASYSVDSEDIDLATSRYYDLYDGGSTFWGSFGCPSSGCPYTSYCDIVAAGATATGYYPAATTSASYDAAYSSYYSSLDSADDAAYSSYYSSYYSSESAAEASDSAAYSEILGAQSSFYASYDSSASDESAFEAFTSSQNGPSVSSTPKVTSASSATRQQTSSQATSRGNGVQSTAQATSTPATQPANAATSGWALSSVLVLAASGVLGLALCL